MEQTQICLKSTLYQPVWGGAATDTWVLTKKDAAHKIYVLLFKWSSPDVAVSVYSATNSNLALNYVNLFWGMWAKLFMCQILAFVEAQK